MSYRTYDGPLKMRTFRWWIIAVARVRYLRTRWWFWLLLALAGIPYFIVGLLLYVQSSVPANAGPGNPLEMLLDRTPGQRFATLFFQALGWQGLWLFLIALAAGAGAIALDNRTNALQVYLSKPLTKRDYLFGKWMGVFSTVYLAAVIPAGIFYLYLLMSYSSEGLLKNEPLLMLRVLVAAAVPAAIHASLITGISAWSKTPLFAGVIYAGMYFFTAIVSTIVWAITNHGKPEQGLILQHCSIGGIIGGLVQNVLGVTMHLTHFRRHMTEVHNLAIPPPNLAIMLGLAVAISIVGVAAARVRIRAVEVVRG